MSSPAVQIDPDGFTRFSRHPSQLRVLLLEGVHDTAVELLHEAGFDNIERIKTALEGEALADKLRDAHIVGIRSRTQLSAAAMANAEQLRAIGCFCIGTNQVDLNAAMLRGVPVFNAPFSNTRSVAELVLAEAIMLMRDIPRKNALAHRGTWLKSAVGSFEVRGKSLGIIGYGHIGSQVGLLAEAIGMRVFFYDVETKLALGNATPVKGLHSLLGQCDVVTCHVPEAPDTRNMIGAVELAKLHEGAVLINASRGSVVDIDALVAELRTGRLGGAALDVFPAEPKAPGESFESALRGIDNVILTPHVGGSTEEAQESIGVEVAEKLVKFNLNGSTVSAVNFPEVALPPNQGSYRLLHIHRNQPGVMASVNAVFSDSSINISGEFLQTNSTLGYVVVDFDVSPDFDIARFDALKRIEGTLRARIVHR